MGLKVTLTPWDTALAKRQQQQIPMLPKVDLRRHLTGSIRPATAHELLRQVDAAAADDLAATEAQIQFQGWSSGESLYRDKTARLQQCYVSLEAVERIAYEAIRDAAEDRVIYVEIHVAPHKIAERIGASIEQVFEALARGRDRAMSEGGIRASYVLNLGREPDAKAHYPVSRAAFDAGRQLFCAISIHGDNLNFPVGDYAKIINGARRAGLNLTIRAGRTRGASQVVEAITFLGADRVAHGLRVLENEEAAETARMAGIVFEVALTANVLTREVRRYRKHPFLTMRDHDIPAVLCTNDPTVCYTTMSSEYIHAVRSLSLSLPGVQQSILDAADGAFLPPMERETLLDELIEGFAQILPNDQLLTALE
jgi:adenosine deaminase